MPVWEGGSRTCWHFGHLRTARGNCYTRHCDGVYHRQHSGSRQGTSTCPIAAYPFLGRDTAADVRQSAGKSVVDSVQNRARRTQWRAVGNRAGGYVPSPGKDETVHRAPGQVDGKPASGYKRPRRFVQRSERVRKKARTCGVRDSGCDSHATLLCGFSGRGKEITANHRANAGMSISGYPDSRTSGYTSALKEVWYAISRLFVNRNVLRISIDNRNQRCIF